MQLRIKIDCTSVKEKKNSHGVSPLNHMVYVYGSQMYHIKMPLPGSGILA